ncbi:MAG: hypothetical protein H0W43_05140 [Chthoniobacterales bacterium]|nr:hypothetical protein [Chthoniobacterales bacterium]
MKGLPGHYWIGGLFSPWSGFTEFGTNDKRSGSYGFYVHGDQMLYQEQPGSDHGMTIWTASGPEVGHRMQLTSLPSSNLTLRWVIRPGGTGRIPDALVIGAEMGITF